MRDYMDEPYMTKREFRDWYKQSADWNKKREFAIRRARYRCEQCGARATKGQPLEVDHKTYMRLGRENPDDYWVLCQACHDQNPMTWESARQREARRHA